MSADFSQRFLFAQHDFRGELVCLSESYQTIMRQHGYPLPIRRILGEALLAVVLMSSTMKFEGQLTLQFESDGAIELLVAKCTHDLAIRGLAQWSDHASQDALSSGLADGQLVVTLEQPHAEPYQSIVPVESGALSAALERYFLQSEQLPSLFRFVVEDTHATGMLLQMMPAESQAALEAWHQAKALVGGLPDALLQKQDSALILVPFEELGDIRLFDARPVSFRCPCTVARMEAAVSMMGEAAIRDILISNQEVEVVCEYCSNTYAFTKDEINRIFQQAP